MAFPPRGFLKYLTQTPTWAHTRILLHFYLFNGHISLSVLTNLDIPFSLSCLHSNDNESGKIPDTPSTMLDIVLSTTIESSWEHEDHRPKHCQHEWDQSLWMTCTHSLWSLRIRACALFPCHGVLRLKSSRLWAVSLDEAFSPQTSPSPVSCQHTTSNGHPKDEWILCLVGPQCSLL